MPESYDMANNTMPKFISIQDAAEMVGVSTKTIRRWIAHGKLTAHRPSQRVIRIDPADICRLMDATATTRFDGEVA